MKPGKLEFWICFSEKRGPIIGHAFFGILESKHVCVIVPIEIFISLALFDIYVKETDCASRFTRQRASLYLGITQLLITILAPDLRAKIKALIIIFEYLSDQSWRTSYKKYMSAPLTGCSLKKLWARRLMCLYRSVGRASCPFIIILSESSTIHLTVELWLTKAREMWPNPPPMLIIVSSPPDPYKNPKTKY